MDVSLSELREMVMDREAWRAAIHVVTKSRTQLSNWTELNWITFSFDYKVGRNVYFYVKENKVETVLVHVIWISLDMH